MVDSVKASLNASDLLQYLTTAKLGETSTWKGDTDSFILHWGNQHRLYDAMVEVVDQFSPAQKHVVLQNAVHPIPELRAVKLKADMAKTLSGKVLSYDE